MSSSSFPLQKRYRLVIFDFDGTLADSFPWFLSVINDVADRFSFRRIAPDEVERLRVAGAREIVKALGIPFWKLPQIASHMRALKARSSSDIELFAGAGEMLRTLKAAGNTLAIVSSDSEAGVRASLGAANAALISTYSCGASLLGKAAKFKQVLRQTGAAPREAIAIGDEMRDIEAALKAGIDFGAVTWGYARPEALERARPVFMFQRMEDIVRELGRAPDVVNRENP